MRNPVYMSRSKTLAASTHLQSTPEVVMVFIFMTELSSAIIVGDVPAMFVILKNYWGAARGAAELSTGLAREKVLCQGIFPVAWLNYWPTDETNQSWDDTFGQGGEILVEAAASMASNFDMWHEEFVRTFSWNEFANPGCVRAMLLHWGPNAGGCEALLKSWKDCLQKLQQRSTSANPGMDTITYGIGSCQSYTLMLLGRQDLAQEYILHLGTDPEHADATVDSADVRRRLVTRVQWATLSFVEVMVGGSDVRRRLVKRVHRVGRSFV